MAILIVDDERDLREIMAFNLLRAGFDTMEAGSAEEAMPIMCSRDNGVELILLDVMMGGMSGFEFAEALREKGIETPVIFLTALSQEMDLLKGFSVGGDDYIAKPFSVAEVVARVKAVLSRTMQQSSKEIKVGNITIDVEQKSVEILGTVIQLTKTEFGLLYILANRPQKTFSREELLDKVWGDDVFVESRTVDVHITRLRKKIKDSDVSIVSRSGYGYSLNANDSDEQ